MGIDPRGLAGSTVLEAKTPLVFEGKFDPGFRIELHLKDLLNVMKTAHQLGVPVPFSSLATEVMIALKVAAKGELDHGGVAQYFEGLAGIDVC